MAVIRFGRFIPTTLREWERILEPLNKVIAVDENGSATVTADNLPPQDAQYLTLSNNATLTASITLLLPALHPSQQRTQSLQGVNLRRTVHPLWWPNLPN